MAKKPATNSRSTTQSVRRLKTMSTFTTTRALLSKLHGQHFGGSRDLYEVMGYPRAITCQDYEETYKRGDIGARIIDAFPDATWREAPIIKAEGDKDGNGAFKKAVDELAEKFKLWYAFSRLDRLMGMGHYGVLHIGVDGGDPVAEPIQGKSFNILYLAPHGESTAEVTRWDDNVQSPRYGKPLLYNLTTGVARTGQGGGERRITVHQSRCIHVAERALDDEAIGIPRLERIFNRLMDVDKTLGGSAEVYWQNAAMIRAWIADPEVEWDPEEQDAMKAELEALMHGLRRDVRVRGVQPENLAGNAQDPSGVFEKLIDIIAGSEGIPKRILIGSERGELSSEQDEVNWANRIKERRTQFAAPHVIRPFIDWCILYGVLKAPEGGKYTVEWMDNDGLGEQAKATVAQSKAAALQSYVSTPGAEFVVPQEEFRSKFLGLDPVSDYTPEPIEGKEVLDEEDPDVTDQFAANKQSIIANANPRSLYVRRNVVNGKDILRWARDQGFKVLLNADDLHVTIAYSDMPVDWMKVGETYSQREDGTLRIAPGGARVVEHLGPDGAIVLMFTSSELSWRWFHIKECGASWKYGDDYQPHITLTYEGQPDLDLSRVEPYRGPIILGPEIFEEVNHDYTDEIEEVRTNARMR